MIGLKVGPEYKKFNGKWFKKDQGYTSKTLATARRRKLTKEGYITRLRMVRAKKIWYIIWKRKVK